MLTHKPIHPDYQGRAKRPTINALHYRIPASRTLRPYDQMRPRTVLGLPLVEDPRPVPAVKRRINVMEGKRRT